MANNDIVHKRSNVEFDVEELVQIRAMSGTSGADVLQGRDLEMEARNLKDQCQAVTNCVKGGAQWTVATGYYTWVLLADYAKPAGVTLMKYLNQPFWANAGTSYKTTWDTYH